MESELINADLIIKIRNYLKYKTGIFYFKHIRSTPDNIQITCPFHKGGQENKSSAAIRVTPSDRAVPGLFSCFTCHETMMIDEMVAQILGPLYDEEEVESELGLKSLRIQTDFIKPKQELLFKIPEQEFVSRADIRRYEGYYHKYLEARRITPEVALHYNIGYDAVNDHIVFPIYDIEHRCVGLGRRSVHEKIYRYPQGLQKPLYGLYELSPFLNYVWVVERAL